MLAACCAGLVSGLGFCLGCLDPLIEASHCSKQLVLLVCCVAIPVALLDVVADGFEDVGFVEVAKLDAVRLVFHCDLAAVDVDCAVLRIEAFCRELVHCVACVLCSERELLFPSLDSYPTASSPVANPPEQTFLISSTYQFLMHVKTFSVKSENDSQ